MEEATREEYFQWFWVNSDFGPADFDVRCHLERAFERETGKKVPKDLSYRTEEGISRR